MADTARGFCEDFAAVVNGYTQTTPLFIALEGETGTYEGLAGALRTALSEKTDGMNSLTVCWRAASSDVEPEPLYALVSALFDGLKRKKKLRGILAETLADFDAAGVGVRAEDEDGEDAPACALLTFGEVYAAAAKALGRAFKRQRLVLVVEGLFLCEPRYAFKALRRAQELLSLSCAAVVVPVPAYALKSAAGKVYGDTDGDAVIRSYFDIRCRLPVLPCGTGPLAALLPGDVTEEDAALAKGFLSAVYAGASLREGAAAARIAGILLSRIQTPDAPAVCFAALLAGLKVRFPEAYALFADERQYIDNGIFSQQQGALPGALLSAISAAYGKKAADYHDMLAAYLNKRFKTEHIQSMYGAQEILTFKDAFLCKVFEYVSLLVAAKGMPDGCRSQGVGKEYAASKAQDAERIRSTARLF